MKTRTRIASIPFRKIGWMSRAACKGEDPEMFFPRYGEAEPRHGEAVQICAGCPVWKECRQWAFDTDDRFGVLGGLTPNQRARIRNREKARA